MRTEKNDIVASSPSSLSFLSLCSILYLADGLPTILLSAFALNIQSDDYINGEIITTIKHEPRTTTTTTRFFDVFERVRRAANARRVRVALQGDVYTTASFHASVAFFERRIVIIHHTMR